MKEGDVDYVAFLTDNKVLGNTYTSCPRHRALLLVAGTLAVLVLVALVAALARPLARCPPPAAQTDREPLSTSAHPTTGGAEDELWPHVRLPDFTIPIHYELLLQPNLSLATSQGRVNISLQLLRASNFLVLHAKNLSLSQVTLHGAVQGVRVMRWEHLLPHDQVYVSLSNSLPGGSHVNLSVEFSSALERDLVGLYLSSYVTGANETRRIAATQFEPTSARRAFPCLDEPALKATFDVILVHDAGHMAYANMRRQDLRPYGGLVASRFERSLRMSTYLVAFVICDYDALTSQLGDVELRVLVPREQRAQGRFALDMTKSSLQFFNDFFRIPYPMAKLDLVGVPDFGPGAMENWGLITFRMSSLLYDEAVTPVRSQERIASTVAHEMAHQWFGNLVTMRWWDDLWLNEGLATFLEVRCLQWLRPDWRPAELFPYSTTQPALELDALDTSHPVSASVRDPADIDALFDSISYNKAHVLLITFVTT